MTSSWSVGIEWHSMMACIMRWSFTSETELLAFECKLGQTQARHVLWQYGLFFFFNNCRRGLGIQLEDEQPQ